MKTKISSGVSQKEYKKIRKTERKKLEQMFDGIKNGALAYFDKGEQVVAELRVEQDYKPTHFNSCFMEDFLWMGYTHHLKVYVGLPAEKEKGMWGLQYGKP